MKEIFNQFAANFNKPGTYLISANVLLVFFLILLFNLGVLPIKNLGDFVFFSVLFLILALYRPGWSFLFFAGTIALENINVAPEIIGITVRPYQFFAAITILAVLIRLITKRLNFKTPKFNWIDGAFVIFAIAGFISAAGALNKSISLKQSIIAASFAAIYFLVRTFAQNLGDLKKIIPFFLSSSAVVVLYGIWQNVRFTHGVNSFEIMPGRPNSTFSEPDWLGIFLVLLLAIIFSLIYQFSNFSAKGGSASGGQFLISNQNQKLKTKNQKFYLLGCWLSVIGCLVLSIISVSRSAWLGVGFVTLSFLLILLINYKWKQFLKQSVFIAIAIFTSMAIVYIFNLTNFQLFNRIQSTGTGLQKITISCDLEAKLPNEIGSVEELEKYNCRHINLEEAKTEKLKGRFVIEIYRRDPNVNIRSQIYQKSWEQIKKHPILGIGWGNIGDILGKDGRGASLNSSNIFLEVWLGAGILGLLAFILIWVYILRRSMEFFLKSDPGEKSLGLFLFLGALALLIPNMFNAGTFLGILWLFLGISNISDGK